MKHVAVSMVFFMVSFVLDVIKIGTNFFVIYG